MRECLEGLNTLVDKLQGARCEATMQRLALRMTTGLKLGHDAPSPPLTKSPVWDEADDGASVGDSSAAPARSSREMVHVNTIHQLLGHQYLDGDYDLGGKSPQIDDVIVALRQVGGVLSSSVDSATLDHAMSTANMLVSLDKMDSKCKSTDPSCAEERPPALLTQQLLTVPAPPAAPRSLHTKTFSSVSEAVEAYDNQTMPRSFAQLLPPPRQLWAISDLHLDSPLNRAWLEALVAGQTQSTASSSTDYSVDSKPAVSSFAQDACIVAGDLCSNLRDLEKYLTMLQGAFGHVLYCVG